MLSIQEFLKKINTGSAVRENIGLSEREADFV